jgi:tetrahydromethanopterin S-methyltransferase subunit C
MIRIREQTEVQLIAIYPDRESLERALRRLHDDGFDMRDVSVIGQGFEATEVPAGVVTTGDLAEAGAAVGAVACGLAGLALGTAFLFVPGLGPMFLAGSLSATLGGAVEGAVVGAVIGGLGGALVGWGIPAVHVQRSETRIGEGEFLLLARVDSADFDYTISMLVPEALDQIEFYERSAL